MSGTMETDVKYLLFRVGDAKYAIPAAQIKEIVTGLPRFQVPFVPRWVRGVLNRHGEPYVILDPQALLGDEPVETRTFILLNLSDDQVAIAISDVLEFRKVDERGLHRISAPDDSTRFFLGAISAGTSEVFVLDAQRMLQKLADDVRDI